MKSRLRGKNFNPRCVTFIEGSSTWRHAPGCCPSRPVSVLPGRSPKRCMGSHSMQKCNVLNNPTTKDGSIFHRTEKLRECVEGRKEQAALALITLGIKMKM
ncbi:hypothetical protein KM043_017137 [Ampulex compressa]|nr:hypothetical protein KM043_017137 [Ampulex compressa]